MSRLRVLTQSGEATDDIDVVDLEHVDFVRRTQRMWLLASAMEMFTSSWVVVVAKKRRVRGSIRN
jgi:hypothetical protein